MTKAERQVVEDEWLRTLPPVRAALMRQKLRAARERIPKPSEVRQTVFPVVRVLCVPEKTLVTLAECINRSSAPTPSGNGKGYPVFEGCQTCPLRELHRSMAPAFQPRRFRAFSVQRTNATIAGRRKAWREGRVGRVPSMDDGPGEPTEET